MYNSLLSAVKDFKMRTKQGILFRGVEKLKKADKKQILYKSAVSASSSSPFFRYSYLNACQKSFKCCFYKFKSWIVNFIEVKKHGDDVLDAKQRY